MTLSAPMRCSALAEQLDEPIDGTVDHRVRWLLVEDRSAWGTDAVEDVLGAALAGALKASGVRALLVRRREGDPAEDDERRAFLVDTDAAHASARSISSIAELDAVAISEGSLAEFGAPHDGPMFLVCTNGKRDACCAVRGRVLLPALAQANPERTWECTHLGGHRFAGNLVCLPHGVIYGRVSADDGPRLAAEYVAGRVDATLLRGRSAWPAVAQVADAHVRRLERVAGIDEVALESADVGAAEASVVLWVRGSRRALALRAVEEEPPRPTSCRADKVESPLHWSVVA